MKLVANMQAVDRRAIEERGIPGLELMERAGAHVARAVLDYIEKSQSGAPRMAQSGIQSRTARTPQSEIQKELSITIVCGAGNNGGDGYVCARLLAEHGFPNVSVLTTPGRLPGDALMSQHRVKKLKSIAMLPAIEAVDRIESADIIVDALFGSGLSRPVEGFYKTLVEAINRAHQNGACVVAVDLPSGIHSGTGEIMGAAVEADITVTFQCGKPGLFLFPGKKNAGHVRVVDIGIPQKLIDEDPSRIFLLDAPQVALLIPKRPAEGHKYTFGNVLVIAGSRSMPGAPALTSEAVLSTGAGMVTLAAPESVFTQGSPVLPEVIRKPLSENSDGFLRKNSLDALLKELSKYNVIAVGPGMGHEPDTLSFFTGLLDALLALESTPIILDADALNCLAAKPVRLNARFILTPHVGEAKRLLALPKESTMHVLEMAAALQQKSGAQVVLKSATTVVADSDGQLWINATGNTGMATAGSGDVLTGVISALAAQGCPPADATKAGVYLHGLAGDLAARQYTEYCLRAGLISAFMSEAFKKLPEFQPV